MTARQHDLDHSVLPFGLETFVLECYGAKIFPGNENCWCMLIDTLWRSQNKPSISPQHFFIVYKDAEEDKGTLMILSWLSFLLHFSLRTAKSCFHPCHFCFNNSSFWSHKDLWGHLAISSTILFRFWIFWSSSLLHTWTRWRPNHVRMGYQLCRQTSCWSIIIGNVLQDIPIHLFSF